MDGEKEKQEYSRHTDNNCLIVVDFDLIRRGIIVHVIIAPAIIFGSLSCDIFLALARLD